MHLSSLSTQLPHFINTASISRLFTVVLDYPVYCHAWHTGVSLYRRLPCRLHHVSHPLLSPHNICHVATDFCSVADVLRIHLVSLYTLTHQHNTTLSNIPPIFHHFPPRHCPYLALTLLNSSTSFKHHGTQIHLNKAHLAHLHERSGRFRTRCGNGTRESRQANSETEARKDELSILRQHPISTPDSAKGMKLIPHLID